MFRWSAMGNASAAASSVRLNADATGTPALDVIRILLVDDDPQARALIEIALAEARFQPILDV
ncbi:MAG: hypothetical protein ACRD3G_30740, partial [Vicinamibacterales bacterium]